MTVDGLQCDCMTHFFVQRSVRISPPFRFQIVSMMRMGLDDANRFPGDNDSAEFDWYLLGCIGRNHQHSLFTFVE